MDFHPVDLLISLINIIVLFILLRMILWKYVIRFLKARADRVRSELEEVDKRRASVDAMQTEYEEKIAGIEADARGIMRESQIKATEEAEEILLEARDKARAMLQDARERIEEEKDRAIENTQAEIAQLATDMAARILRREVSAGDSKDAARRFFSES